MNADPRTRTLKAAELIAGQYGVGEQLKELERAVPGEWEPPAVALLIEQPVSEARRKMRA